MSNNQVITANELRAIRSLDDFDLIMLISEVHDHGWSIARNTLRVMPKAKEILRQDQESN